MKRIYAILKDYSIYYRNTVKLVKGIITWLQLKPYDKISNKTRLLLVR